MTDDLIARLWSEHGYNQFRETLTALLENQDFRQVERWLGEFTVRLNSEIGDICRHLGADDVVTVGWDAAWASIERCSGQELVTAMGFDLSPYVADGFVGKRAHEPGIETSYYSDKAFPFSSATRSELLRTDRPWRGNFIDVDFSLEVRGLAKLHDAVSKIEAAGQRPTEVEVPSGFVDALIGSAYLVLRVHESVTRDGQANGLPRAMPILVGDNNFGPFYINSVCMINQVADHSTSTDRILNAEATANRLAHDADTQEMVDGLIRRRQAIISSSQSISSDKRASFIAYAEVRDAGLLQALGVNIVRKTWEMSEYDFADLIDQVRRVRSLDPEDFPAPSPRPRRASVLGFGRKRR